MSPRVNTVALVEQFDRKVVSDADPIVPSVKTMACAVEPWFPRAFTVYVCPASSWVITSSEGL